MHLERLCAIADLVYKPHLWGSKAILSSASSQRCEWVTYAKPEGVSLVGQNSSVLGAVCVLWLPLCQQLLCMSRLLGGEDLHSSIPHVCSTSQQLQVPAYSVAPYSCNGTAHLASGALTIAMGAVYSTPCTFVIRMFEATSSTV